MFMKSIFLDLISPDLEELELMKRPLEELKRRNDELDSMLHSDQTTVIVILIIACVVIVLLLCIYFIRKHRRNNQNDSNGLSKTLIP